MAADVAEMYPVVVLCSPTYAIPFLRLPFCSLLRLMLRCLLSDVFCLLVRAYFNHEDLTPQNSQTPEKFVGDRRRFVCVICL